MKCSLSAVIPYPFFVMYAMGASPPSPVKGLESMATSSHVQLSVFFFLGCIAIVIALLLLIILLRKARSPAKEIKFITQSGSNQASADILSGNLHSISYINYNTLKKATKNFHQDNLLGRGGFGPVYQGKLEDGRMVAIKKLSLEKSQQGESEFLAEVRLITSIQHKNLLRLIGCCSDGPQRLLVYEFMKNQSLDRIIYGKNNVFLDWNTRFQIIKGTARGLQYLHEDSNVRIVHRDIKASNILLDEKFQPKIGDFGLARFFPEDQAYLSTGFAGTLNGSLTLIEEKRPLFRGYTAPEYAIRGELSEKADLYSFGVLMLEIISSRRNTDLTLPSEMQYLPEYAWKLYERKKLGDLVDPRLKEEGSSVENDILHAIHVGFLCLQPHANLRPPMSEIFAMLTRNAKTVQTPIKPIFLDRRHRMGENNSFDVSEV